MSVSVLRLRLVWVLMATFLNAALCRVYRDKGRVGFVTLQRPSLDQSSSPFSVSSRRQRQRRGVTAPQMIFDQVAKGLKTGMEKIAGIERLNSESIQPALAEIKKVLVDADCNIRVVNALVKTVAFKADGVRKLKGVTAQQQFFKLVKDEIQEVLGGSDASLARRVDGRPTVILLAGLQGTGKTTFASKLAYYCAKKEDPARKKVLLVAADVYRPAAIDQLVTMGGKTNTTVYAPGADIDPVRIAREAVEKAKNEGFDTVVVDTAGRQAIDEDLMDELARIKNTVKPDETLLVVDAMTGQEAAALTRQFDERIGITGAVLTKLDGDTRGGAALSVRGVSGKPIKFAGVGERVEDIELFRPDRMASRIVGMGDMMTLVEKAQDAFDSTNFDQVKIFKKVAEDRYDFNDFMGQIEAIGKMGGVGKIFEFLPGMADKMNNDVLRKAAQNLKIFRKIHAAMTPEERKNPKAFIRGKQADERITRIAAETGLTMYAVRSFTTQFMQIRKAMKQQTQKTFGSMDYLKGKSVEDLKKMSPDDLKALNTAAEAGQQAATGQNIPRKMRRQMEIKGASAKEVQRQAQERQANMMRQGGGGGPK
uniref:signal-recognition-particle GTPase n=1 Tax=Chromera velia CCMP2878 TaxID=1169474 RepID=A0A0G4FBS1_9ALVE|eukprot:Cvel_16187.t1-p1 / transcript=Cvel_16187.t1 / gene=Cvel_16187 / organism=Chromera_velia_CCMP2878 / gene_product=Signal recognition particle protein, putative / transcript_product=Signal recognition particle protein, putative / location=Cvel_scaffold1235:22683-29602(+) / protein_length=593 / sequence_SO=supercontig / SO=protein_coding / is_pseudo=false